MLLDIKEGNSDLLSHLITEEANHMRNDIEQSVKEEMQKEIVKQKNKTACLSKERIIRSHSKGQHKFHKEVKHKTQG